MASGRGVRSLFRLNISTALQKDALPLRMVIWSISSHEYLIYMD